MLVFALAILAAVQAQTIPLGFATWFNGTSCPSGWIQVSNSSGRLIVSVNNASLVGLTVNDPLGDQENRTHLHSYSASVYLSEKDVAADGCCDNRGAQNGQYSTTGSTAGSATDLPFYQMLLCATNTTVAGNIPFGTVAYFDSNVTSCPQNWVPFDLSSGRLLMAGFDPTSPIISPEPPLESQEDRQHSHTVSSSIQTNNLDYVGIAGCCNDSPSEQNTYPVQGTASNSSTGLPYLQLLTCVSQVQSFEVDLPENAFLFSPETGCPTGWELVTDFAGRFLVSLPENGTANVAFGGPSMSDTSTGPVHEHSFSGAFNIPYTSIGLLSGCCADGYASAGVYDFEGSSNGVSIGLPFLMLPLCQQTAASRRN